MSEELKVELKSVMNTLFEGIMTEAMAEHHETVTTLVEKHGDRLLNPEHFRLLVSHKHDEIESVLMKTLLSKIQLDSGQQFTRTQAYNIEAVYEDYQFFELQIRRIIEDYEGSGCCADKSRYLLKAYISYIKTGVLPDFGNRSQYWIPMFGSPSAWMDVLSRCHNLLYGQFDYYKEVRDVLIQEIEEGLKERKERLDKLLVAHPNFSKKEEEALEKPMTLYTFITEDEDSYFCGQIAVYEKSGIGYSCNTRRDGATEGRLGYGDEKPDWFEKLLDDAR